MVAKSSGMVSKLVNLWWIPAGHRLGRSWHILEYSKSSDKDALGEEGHEEVKRLPSGLVSIFRIGKVGEDIVKVDIIWLWVLDVD